MTRIVCWNIGKRKRPWTELLEMEVDVALLQEASRVPPGLRRPVEAGPQDPWEPWEEGLYDRGAMVVKLSERVEIEWFKRVFPISVAKRDEIPVSGIGAIAAARVRERGSRLLWCRCMRAGSSLIHDRDEMEGRLPGWVGPPNHLGSVNLHRRH